MYENSKTSQKYGRNMKKRMLQILVGGLVAALFTPANAYNGKLVNAIAVSVQWRQGTQDWAPMCCECGSEVREGPIVLYTIQNSRVTKRDTIYSRINGLASYPAFNLSGTRIAFYRLGHAPAASGTGCVSVNGGKSYISVINPDGTGLTNLCELQSLPQKGVFELDWPAGDWIYFQMPHVNVLDANQGNASVMFWRVNAVTKVAEKVGNFTNDGSGAELKCAYAHRFTLSLDAKHMALMTYPKDACNGEAAATEYFSHVNTIYSFPPPNGNLGNTCLGYRDGCNISISPSGKIVANYFAGWHDDMQLGTPDYSTGFTCSGIGNDNPSVGLKIEHVWLNYNSSQPSSNANLAKWAGEFVGYGSEMIRWSANSDKWVGQCVGFTGTGHAGSQGDGSNQVVCNFIDSVAINVSKNPTTPPGDVNGQGVIRYNNCTGDFWVSDPANNPNGDRYEDLQGVWHTIDGTAVSRDGNPAGLPRFSANAISVTVSGHDVQFQLPSKGMSRIVISDITGKTVARISASGCLRLPVRLLGAGAYVIMAKYQETTRQFKMVLR
jgi:hypothetical protein